MENLVKYFDKSNFVLQIHIFFASLDDAISAMFDCFLELIISVERVPSLASFLNITKRQTLPSQLRKNQTKSALSSSGARLRAFRGIEKKSGR